MRLHNLKVTNYPFTWYIIIKKQHISVGRYTYKWDSRVWNCDQLVANATENWVLTPRILTLATNRWLSFSILNWQKNQCLRNWFCFKLKNFVFGFKQVTYPLSLKYFISIESNLAREKMILKDPQNSYKSCTVINILAPPCQRFQLPAIWWAHVRNMCFAFEQHGRLLCAWLQEGFVQMTCKKKMMICSVVWTKKVIYLTKALFQLNY